eukprot:gene18562-22349_t
MALTWLHALWIDVLAHGPRHTDDNAAASSSSSTHQQTIRWLMVVTLEAWQVISAWFIAHQSPPGRHMVAIAHWMESLLTEAFLPVVQQVSAQVEHQQQQLQLQLQPQQQPQQLVQSSVPLVLIAATLQSAIQFFHVCLTMLKPLHHGPRNVVSQIQDDCDGLWTHLVTFILDAWAAEPWGDAATATAITTATANATATAASIDVARE